MTHIIDLNTMKFIGQCKASEVNEVCDAIMAADKSAEPHAVAIDKIGDSFKGNQLVAIFNANVSDDEQIKKFSDKKTAVRRITQIAENVETLSAGEVAPAKPKGKKASKKKAGKKVAPKAPKEPSTPEEEHERRSKGVAESWKNPEVAAKRSKRDGVFVGKEHYRSVRAAFEALGLPLEKHIPFRMIVKENGKATFEHEGTKYNFQLESERV